MKTIDKFFIKLKKVLPERYDTIKLIYYQAKDESRVEYQRQRYIRDKANREKRYKEKVEAQGKVYIPQRQRVSLNKRYREKRIKELLKEYKKTPNMAELGRKYNLSRERVRQLLN